MEKYKVIGVMSGTSLDGVDIAYCEFTHKKGKWSYHVLYSITYQYSDLWKEKLRNLPDASAYDIASVDNEYGLFLGKILAVFIRDSHIKPDIIASHGHTIFHNPDQYFTCQIGNGAPIASLTKVPVINNFRSSDVAKGGQGAPLVPIGDKWLFGEYDFCLNLGGIANISFDDEEGQRVAFDIAPCNMALNYLAAALDLPYDDEGQTARNGRVDISLLEELNSLDFYWKSGAKSIGREWFEQEIIPILSHSKAPPQNKLATLTEHIAHQIGKVITKHFGENLLITGGGAHNTYLVERITQAVTPEVIVPHKTVVDYKEAIIFAFLGTLRYRSQTNILKSVTGASSDSIAGTIWLP
ncbi:MAG: anhydro-N-acetylmuramic acid kinase [Bacteroidales bacterium]|nr:anhydro-N-acetylmuramic acid kinase [Bacteroidales bacterium]MCF8332835.1 anhydro-N-acetylmuramic acid kinase [Bacteroidales bacterium]